jgi:hypothetical protein
MNITDRYRHIGIIKIIAFGLVSLFGLSGWVVAARTAFAAKSRQTSSEKVLDQSTVHVQLPSEIKWSENRTTGSLTATLYGDPTKPGLYITLNKWPAHKMGLPHIHPNDRYITVISGTWWVGTGTEFDPDHTVPVPAGSFVTHFAKQPHFDGAKDEDTVLEVVGMGPGTSTPVSTAK